jgi:hypothetical protein
LHLRTNLGGREARVRAGLGHRPTLVDAGALSNLIAPPVVSDGAQTARSSVLSGVHRHGHQPARRAAEALDLASVSATCLVSFNAPHPTAGAGERGSGRSSPRQLTDSTDRSTRSPAYTSTATNVGTTHTAARTFAPGQRGPAPSRHGIWILLLARLAHGTRYSVEVSVPGPLACKVLKNAYLNGETITRRHRDDPTSSFAAPPQPGVDANRRQRFYIPDKSGPRVGTAWRPAGPRHRRPVERARSRPPGSSDRPRLAAEDRRRDVTALSGR